VSRTTTYKVHNFSSVSSSVLGAIGSDDQRLVPLKCTMANEEANGLETGLREQLDWIAGAESAAVWSHTGHALAHIPTHKHATCLKWIDTSAVRLAAVSPTC
jgi:hypothetical protein